MPLDLHPECRKRLVEALVEGLPRITTTNGMFLEHRSRILGLLKAEEVIPKTGNLKNRLLEYVNDYPVIDFFSEALATELKERDRYLRRARPSRRPWVLQSCMAC